MSEYTEAIGLAALARQICEHLTEVHGPGKGVIHGVTTENFQDMFVAGGVSEKTVDSFEYEISQLGASIATISSLTLSQQKDFEAAFSSSREYEECKYGLEWILGPQYRGGDMLALARQDWVLFLKGGAVAIKAAQEAREQEAASLNCHETEYV